MDQLETKTPGVAMPERTPPTTSKLANGQPTAVATQPVASALIHVKNLRLRTYIGFNPEEKAKQQDVTINVEIRYWLAAGVFHDQVADALDYKLITKQVIDLVEDGRFLLLEKLVADVLAICSAPPQVSHAKVCIDKPHALRFADSVSLTLEYHAGDDDSVREKIQ